MNKQAFYNGATTGESMETIMERIIVIHEENQPNKKSGTAGFFSFEEVKDKVSLKVVSSKNKKQLKDSLYMELPGLDLAVVFFVDLGTYGEFRATCRINEHHLSLWKISKKELHDLPIKNAGRKYHFTIENMIDVIGSVLDEAERKKLEDEFDFGKRMFVLTDESSKNYGSCAIYLNNVIRDFAENSGCDIFILPSSTHELILLKDDGFEFDVSNFETTVREVNLRLDEEEFLSDSVYKFIRSINRIVKL